MAAEILYAIEEGEKLSSRELAKKLDIPMDRLEKILADMMEKSVLEYDRQSGRIRLSDWIVSLGKELEDLKPTTGAIILPKNQEIKLQDVLISNFTNTDLELLVRLKTNLREIALCALG
jgi:DNA-binding transcriptional regulator YhcF (GntR family)